MPEETLVKGFLFMKIFHQSVVDYQIEKSINPQAKLCFDHNRKCYVISNFFTSQRVFNCLNWEVIHE